MTTGKSQKMSVKLLLTTTTVLILVIILFPLLTTATSEIPTILTAVKSYLRPPYLYVIINCIIITIAASSRLHNTYLHAPPTEQELHVPLVSTASRNDVIAVRMKEVGVVDVEEDVKEMMNNSSIGEVAVEEEKEEEEVVVEEKVLLSPPPSVPKVPLRRQEAVAGYYNERPLAASRFGNHRRPNKVGAMEGGKALRRVAKLKKHDTLESTWKAITEGRHIPLTRHLKKSDTWENTDSHQIDLLDLEVKKSKTFTDRSNQNLPPIPAKVIKKEPSLGQDELNRRVEAFINKFNEDMRLQRQQSMQQFMEMINRAT